MEIAIIPSSDEYLGNKLFDMNNENLNRDNILYPYYELRESLSRKNININTIDYYKDINKVDYIFFWGLNYKYILKFILMGMQNKMIYFAWEPEVVIESHSMDNLIKLKKYFKYIFTWNDDLVDEKNFLKIFNPYHLDNKEIKKMDFKDKKLLVNISGNKKSHNPKELYSERLRVIEYFEDNNDDDFDLYGIGWDESKFKNYKGKVKDKFETYGKYKFALSLENMKNVNGYITEKILDCFKAEIVPIYCGPENILNYIPKETFINYADFDSVYDLINYIRNISEEEYSNYIKKIKEYKESNNIKVFSSENFINIIENMLNINDKQYLKVKALDKIILFYNIAKSKLNKMKR